MRRLVTFFATVAAVGMAAFWFVTRPDTLPRDALAGLVGDEARGERIFWAGGCASCHMAPGSEGARVLELAGGQKFPSPFGTFIAPNISPDPVHGIGGWSAHDLANAMTRGVSPAGQHYFPVFPYTSFARARFQDIVDLYAFLLTLPAVETPSLPHDVGFPFDIRRAIGVWKRLFFNKNWVVSGDLSPTETRGRYLSEALAHCGECHTPRNILGAMERDRWLAGGPIPGGKGNFPNITPAKLDWSEADIVEYLTSGFTPDYDSAGGHMALVVDNMAHLPPEDRTAIAAYLKKVPPAE
ncbi:MAG: cytochrome c [Rhodobacteraceae bacterium]|nr:cytochrome c [Paracoccaceae bacterium]MCP5340804.1 cytochrome c [Paracoccaceae bacterium]